MTFHKFPQIVHAAQMWLLLVRLFTQTSLVCENKDFSCFQVRAKRRTENCWLCSQMDQLAVLKVFPKASCACEKEKPVSFFLLSIPQGGYRSSTGWWFNPCLLGLPSACLNAFGQELNLEFLFEVWVLHRKYLGVKESSLVLMWSRKML